MASPKSNAVRLHNDYVAAQRWLLDRLESASRGERPWPHAREYEAIAQMGRSASAELRSYLADLKNVRRASRVGRIQRLSAGERNWQPSPELWLSRQDAQGCLPQEGMLVPQNGDLGRDRGKADEWK